MSNKYEYAGFWIRVGAAIIDTIILIIAIMPITFLWGMGMVTISSSLNMESATEWFMQIITAVFYIFCWVKFAGTPGKRLLRLKILDEITGENITAGQGIIRYIGSIISALVLLIGIIWVAFDAKKQGWHDKMARTVVVREL
ncbi:MAG: RDD family protein [Acinetobacter sp.]|jgi:uncharacterized RDD family membrane protein YckC